MIGVSGSVAGGTGVGWIGMNTGEGAGGVNLSTGTPGGSNATDFVSSGA